MVGLKQTKLPIDKKGNIRLANIAYYFTELKKLRRLLKENREHYDFLFEFRELPIALLEELGVDRLTSEAVFAFDGMLTPDFIESFRKTKSRNFWGGTIETPIKVKPIVHFEENSEGEIIGCKNCLYLKRKPKICYLCKTKYA